MVDTNSAAGCASSAVPDPALVDAMYECITAGMPRFLFTAADGQSVYSPHALAVLVAEMLTSLRSERAGLWALLKRSVRTNIELAGQNTAEYIEWFDLHTDLTRLRAGLSGVLGHDPAAYPGDERVLADLRKLAGESRVQESEVISLGCEVEKLERALEEAARESASAARFVTTMLG